MKQQPPGEAPRLEGQHLEEDPSGLARLVRSTIHAPRDPVPHLKGRIRSTLRRKSAGRRRYVRAAIVGGIIFVAGAVVGAVVQPIVRFRKPTKVASVQNIYPSATGGRARNRRMPSTTALPDVESPAPEQYPDLASAPAAADSPSWTTEPSGAPVMPAPSGPGPSPPHPPYRAAATSDTPSFAPAASRAPNPAPPTPR